MKSSLLFLAASLLFSTATRADTPVTAVKEVDLNRYLGRWFDVRSIPNRFQKGCTDTTATYSLNADQSLRVENECTILDNDNGNGKVKTSRVVGKAWVKNEGRSQLKVSFACLFGLCTELAGGNYWVLALGPIQQERYSWAIVGEPTRKYGWVLSRTATLSIDQMAEVETRLKEQGYIPSQFSSTPQSTAQGQPQNKPQ